MEKEFKSKTFKYGFLEGDEKKKFKEDIFSLNENLALSKLKEHPEYIAKMISSDDEEKYKIYDKVIELGIIANSQKIYSFHRIVNYFFKKFLDESTQEDNTEIITKDIAKALEIDEDEFPFLNELLKLVKEEAKKYEIRKRRDQYKRGVFPYATSISTSVELKGIFNREIRFEEDIESYKKNLQIDKEKPTTSIISVSLSVDSGTPKQFCFQASQEAIKNMIKELNAALHKSNILENKLKNK